MAEQPTLIERLNVAHEGLEKDVCQWLREFRTCEEIAEELKRKYGEEVSDKTIDNYRQRRFKRSIERIRLQRESYTAFIEAAGEKGLEAGAKARLWESLQAMEPRDLISLQRVLNEAAQIRVDAERVENEKAELALKLKNAEGQIARVKAAVTDGVESNEQIDPRTIREKIQGIFGITPDSPPGHGESAAVPGALDQG